VAGHRFADLSEAGWGVAVLNDCKYGYKIHGGEISLNLLRGPVNPDPDADLGSHLFTYSLLPHNGDLRDSVVFREAAGLNQPALVYPGLRPDGPLFPVSVAGQGVVFETLKRAEDDDSLIVRVWETRGCPTEGRLQADGLTFVETDLMERPIGKTGVETFVLSPYEIKTFRSTGE
jgi:alpha-mannosidase